MEQAEMIIFIALILASAIMIQETVEGLKKYFDNLTHKNFKSFFNQSLAIGFGLASAFVYQIDFISLFTNNVTLLGIVMSGIILSQGADSVRNVLNKLKGVKKESEQLTKEWFEDELKKLPQEEVDDIYINVLEYSNSIENSDIKNELQDNKGSDENGAI